MNRRVQAIGGTERVLHEQVVQKEIKVQKTTCRPHLANATNVDPVQGHAF